MNNFRSLLSVLLVILPPMIFGLVNKPAEMGIALIAGSIAAVFINLEKFTKFSGAGFSAELKDLMVKVDDANVTIEGLKKAVKPLMMYILRNITYQTFWATLPVKKREDTKNELYELAVGIGLDSDADIVSAINEHTRYQTWWCYEGFIHALNNSISKTDNESAVCKRLAEYKDFNSIIYPTKSDIEEIIKDIEMDEKSQKMLERYYFYLNNKKHPEWEGEID